MADETPDGTPAPPGRAAVRAPLQPAVLRELLRAPTGPLRRLEVVPRTGSTNDDVAADLRRDPQSWPDLSLLVADHQAAGRGRTGRSWETPPGTALTCTFVVRPDVPAAALGWVPLLVGLGCVEALRATAGVRAALKWPNDLLVLDAGAELDGWGTDRKVGGVLAEVVPVPGGPPAVVVGVGINVAQGAAELPVPSATSLALAGAHALDRESLLLAVVAALGRVSARWRGAGGDAGASGLHDEVAAVCATLGRDVRVDLPGGAAVRGRAQALEPDGALRVVGADGVVHRILAGDVGHLRRGS